MQGRHELKYYISFTDMLQLQAKLPYVAYPDSNVGKDGSYRVKSLYFDNYADKALREKVDGVNGREKFRIRFYDQDLSFIRLEKKSKKNGICYKEGTTLEEKECRQILQGNFEVLKEAGNPLLLEFYSKMQYQQLRPKNIVDYKRYAYHYQPGNVRLTIDCDLRTSNVVMDFLEKTLITIPLSGTMLLEVKYDAFLPEVIRGLTSLSNRQKSAFSKYAAARIC